MKISELEAELKEENLSYQGFCHDCGKEVEVSVTLVDGKIEIAGGAVYKVKQRYDEEWILKCDKCFRKDKTLRDYKVCEIFTRVVGFLTPVNQWNKGKQAEFAQRKEFKV